MLIIDCAVCRCATYFMSLLYTREPQEPTRNILGIVLVCFLLFLLLLSIVIGIKIVWNPAGPVLTNTYSEMDEDTDLPEESMEPPSGQILLNLQEPHASGTIFAVFDLGKSTLERSLFNYFMPSVSNDKQTALGSGFLVKSATPEVAVFRTLKDTLGDEVLYASTTAQRPFWNVRQAPTGASYTFEVPPEKSTDTKAYYLPSTWSIYLVQDVQEPQFIAHGYNARFSPDGSQIVYLANDGVHAYSVTNKQDRLAVVLDENLVSTERMFDISPDGKMLAMTDAFVQTVSVSAITSWAPFTLGESEVHDIQAFWPVFSPDSQWLAFEQVDWAPASGAEAENRRLTLLNLLSGVVTTVTPLNAFPQSSIIVSDWIE